MTGDRPDLDAMSKDELRAWAAEQRRKSNEAYAGRPLPEVSEVKSNDHPHWERVGWAFSLTSGRPARVRLGRDTLDGTVRGLRAVADDGPLALLVDLGPGGTWAFRRADGVEDWAPSGDAQVVKTEDLDVPVTGWQAPGDQDPLPAPGPRTTSATVRTARLEGDDE